MLRFVLFTICAISIPLFYLSIDRPIVKVAAAGIADASTVILLGNGP